MSNCLMQLNQCIFPNCSQHFANQYDLTAHIEYTHIPVIEEDVKRKKIYAANSDQPMPPPAMNLPLSYYSRVFRTAYRPNPIKPEPLKLSFNHYKKKTIPKERSHSNPNATRYYRDMMARQGRHISIEEAEKRLCDIDFEECGADNPEVRWQCAIVDCNKRYKSMFALRVHMKICHNVVVSEEAKSLTSYPSEDVKPNLAALQQAMQQSSQMNPDRTMSSGTPTSTSTSNTPVVQGSPHPGGPSFGNPATNTTSFKCSYCSKRYKTSSGLSNHMMSSHQKISEAQDVPSQLVVEQLISQVRMQRNQEGSSSGGQSPQKHVSSPSSHFQSVANGSSHARNFSVTTTQQPIRFSQPGFPLNLDNQPSTGQVLPLSQPLPPLSSMTQQQRMPVQQMPSSNSGPMQFSSPDSQGYHNMMPSPLNGQLTPSQQPPPYNP